jgi:iron complex outermembrane recepter protein
MGLFHGDSFARRLVFSAGVTALLFSAATYAQSEIEEITVTAQKREQSAQDVPVTLQAYSADQLRELGAVSASDLAKFTPGLNVAGGSAGQTLLFAIRGVVQEDLSGTTESPVAVYADEGYISTPFASHIGLFDLDHVEVLKGPQGTLFGRNATGGVVNIFSKLPTDTYEGYSEVGYGSYNDKRFEGAFGGPITDQLKFRIAAAYEKNSGWVTNTSPTGGDLGGDDAMSVRGHLEYKPTDDIDVLLTGYFSDEQFSWAPYFSASTRNVYDAAGYVVNSYVVSAPTLIGTQPSNPASLTVDANDAQSTGGHAHLSGGTAKFSWNFGPVLTLVTDAKSSTSSEFLDNDSSPVPYWNTNSNEFADSFTQEARLYDDQGKFRWFTGAYYLHIHSGEDPDLNTGSIFNNLFIDDRYFLTTNSRSLFGQVEYDVLPNVTLVGGLRGTIEDKAFTYASSLYNPEGVYIAPTRTPYAGAEHEPLNSWKGEVEYRPESDAMLYLQYSRGVKAGGFNGPFTGSTAFPDSAIPYKPEKLDSYEVGEKVTFLDGLLQVDSAAFYYDYHDYQAFNQIGLSFEVTNHPAKVYGAETQIIAKPVHALTLEGFASYTHDRVYGVSLAPNPALLTLVAPYTSAWKGGALARYEVANVLGGSLSIQGDVEYTGQYWYSLTNFDSTSVPGYTLTNARLSWTNSDRHWEVGLSGKNLADIRYKTLGFDLSTVCGCSQVAYGRPRWFMGDVTYKY